MLPLFDEPSPIDRTRLAQRLHELAAGHIYLGGSSWKYEGWLGSIYTPERYYVRGRLSKKRFEETCLQEYAETFPIVCGDFSFYNFPSETFWRGLFTQSPEQLRFAFKVPEELTVRIFPTHQRYGARAGLDNPSFLDADLFERAFLELLRPYRRRIPALVIEFGAFPRKAFATPDEFIARLDAFLAALPDDFRYSVEIRNPEFLGPDYFGVLRAHSVAHVFNAWTRMPTMSEQISHSEAFTTDFVLARALLRQGRPYEEAVRLFSPYTRVQEENPEARDALRTLIAYARNRKEAAYLFVNNRLEGSAPGTIQAVVTDE